jgi:LysR family glycine cleavage system transcriptional activator
MSSPPLRFLKTFQIAARLGSFKAAGEELCITASAVSHQIKALENELGLILFDRGPRSLTLTAAGSYYLEHIDAVFSRLDYATQQLRMRHTREVVRLQVPSFFASELLLPRLAAFSARHADTDIQIATDITPNDEHSADFDVSIIVGQGDWQDVQAIRLFAQTYIPACAPMLRHKWRIDSPADLVQRPLIAHNQRPDLWERWAMMAGVDMLRPQQLIHFDTMSAVVNAAEQGVGIALVSAPLSDARFQSGSLLRLFDQELATGESYYLVTRPTDAGRTGVANLVRWMLQQFGGASRQEPILAMHENR